MMPPEAIMIGNAATGVRPSSASTTMLGAYHPMPIVLSAPKMKLAVTATDERPAREPARRAADWKCAKIAHDERHCRYEQGGSHEKLNRTPPHAADHTRPEPGAGRGARHHGHEQLRVHRDDGHEYDGLDQTHGNTADIEGAWNQLVGRPAAETCRAR